MDFLSAIVPTEGYTLFTTLEKNPDRTSKNPKRARNYWGNIHADDVQSFIDRYQTGAVDLYYAMASFRKEGTEYDGRSDDNVYQLKSLWLDIDAGPEKYAKQPNTTYRDFDEAWDALQKWLDDSTMWEPTYIVSSGEGIHVYWALDKPVSVAMWRSLNAGLRKLVRQHGMKLDNGTSMRMSGILRVPGTIHTKSGRTVTIESSEGGLYTVEQLREAIPFVDVSDDNDLGHMPEHLLDDKRGIDEAWETHKCKFSMQKLMDISLAGNGCEQMALCYEDQPGTNRYLWRGALSIAVNCIDGEEWTHKISCADKARYSPAETDKEANSLRNMPYTCAKWAEYDPDPCENCPLLGEIKSPIVLGRVIEEATPEQVLELANNKPQIQKYETRPEQKAELTLLARAVEDTTVKPLALPYGYSYATDGGLIRTKKNGEQDIIYRYPLLILNRVYSKAEGETLIMQVNLPHDEPRIFNLSLEALSSDDKLRAALSSNGVIVTSKEKWAEIMSFLRRAAEQSQEQRRADRQHLHYGWTDEMDAFVIGNTEYHQDGSIRPMVLPYDDGRLDKAFNVSPDASIEGFKKVFDLFNKPGFELPQFVLGVGLASPLFRLLDIQGCLVHSWTDRSGAGKTTTAQLATAMWGRPVVNGGTGLMGLERDTSTALYIKLGQLNSIATMIDEITKRHGDELSDMVYAVTQGRDKDRGQAQANKLRDNQGNWSMAVLSTGNLSVTRQLIEMDALSEALNARVIELDFSGIPSLWGPNHEHEELVEMTFRDAKTIHAGVIGRDFIRQLLANKQGIMQMYYDLRKECTQYFGFSQKERFWINTVCCALLAIKLGNDLNYWEFDIDAIKARMKEVLLGTRTKVTAAKIDGETLLSMFLANTTRSRLVVNNSSGVVPANAMPAGPVGVREEQDTGLFKISDTFVRDWCMEHTKNYDMFIQQIESMGAVCKRGTLMAGVTSMAGRVTESIWVINLKEGENNAE